MTAQSPGRAPELADVVVAPGMKPVEFRLGPGHTIRGRVVNPAGKPLDGVTVQAMNWKGHSSLDWTTKTDSPGPLHLGFGAGRTGAPDIDQSRAIPCSVSGSSRQTKVKQP